MSDERASRLRSRRGKARERAEAQQAEAEERERESADEPADESTGATERADAEVADTTTGGTTETPVDESDAKGASETEDEDARDGSVKEERVGTYMYLPESQKRELQRVYGTLKVQYEYEFDEEFEKNRHFFPAVVRHGLETLDGMDAADVREVVDDID